MRPEHLARAGELADEVEMVKQILPTSSGSTHYKLCAYDLMLMYCAGYGVVYSIHGIYSHASDLTLLALGNPEIVGVLGEG
jgi:hypothetical protein